ncbi:MAG: arginine--tRNA ligase [Patescibacteria group bacterium]
MMFDIMIGDMLEVVKRAGDKAIDKTKKRIAKELLSKKRVVFDNYTIVKIKKSLSEILDVSQNSFSLEIPPSYVKTDLSVSLFELAKEKKVDPKNLAEELAIKINETKNIFFENAQALGPYLNLNLKKQKAYELLLREIAKLKNKFGQSDINKNNVVVIDYSGPNIAKPFGVGHLRSTIIGQALVNIYESTGYCVVKDNHLGDWGTQFGKLIYAYNNWVDKKKFKENPIEELNILYVRFHEEVKKNPSIEDDARKIFQQLEVGDENLLKTWSKFEKISVSEFNKVYKKLGISFDTFLGESYFVGEAEKIIQDALDKKVAFEDPTTGAIAVELGGLPSFLLRKQDGSTLYITRDLATLKFRTETFNPQETLYVVGEEQSLHFRQMFTLAKALGYADGNTAKHIGFGLVSVDGEKMSTRKGTLVRLEELIDQSIAKAKEILMSKNKDLLSNEVEEISEIVGMGAVIYNDLRQSRQKNISFDWEKMLDFEGGSAVYLQYTVARINSILKKLNNPRTVLGNIVLEKESEFALAKKMMFFPMIILEARKNDSPHLVAVYLEELAQLFNHFYNEVSIIGTENEVLRLARIALIKSTAIVIKNGLTLLGVKIPEKI